MKKIINGSRYDTDTAKALGWWETTPDTRDLYYYSEELYRTKAGKYFLHIEGGAGSEAAVQTGSNEWSFGEHIRPISEDTARKWAEKHLDGDGYEKAFGTVDDSITQVAAYLPDSLLRALDAYKADHKMSRSDIIIEALKKFL